MAVKSVAGSFMVSQAVPKPMTAKPAAALISISDLVNQMHS